MKHSESIGKISLALSKAQGQMDCANKSSDNPFFKSKYADLHECIQAAKKPLTENELCVVQTTELSDDGIIINTLLSHSSGEWFLSQLRMKPKSTEDQKIGCSITYGRRYSYAAIIGIAQKDDDGEGNRKEEKPKNTKEKKVNSAHWEELFDKANCQNLAAIKAWRKKNGNEITATIESRQEAAKLRGFLDDNEADFTPKKESSKGGTVNREPMDKEADMESRTSIDKWIKWVLEHKKATVDVFTQAWEEHGIKGLEGLPPKFRKELLAARETVIDHLTKGTK